jgi:RNA polymerase sigma-70 factor (sigma-B/F/G subfamily)
MTAGTESRPRESPLMMPKESTIAMEQRPARPERGRSGRVEALLAELSQLPEDDPRRERLRSQIVDEHAPMARSIARRYAHRGEPLEDIEQAAFVGLVKAINRWDPELGENFIAYAAPMMTGEVKRHFRDRTWGVHMPRRLQELSLALTPAVQEFVRKHGKSPTTAQIAEQMGLTIEETVEVIAAWDSYRPVSLDAPASDDPDAQSLGDSVGSADPDLDLMVDGHALRPLIDELPERERKILLLRFFGNKTQSQIGEEIGISQMHVSRLLSRSLQRLRGKLLSEH